MSHPKIGGIMRLSTRAAVAVVGLAALFATAACSSGGGGGGTSGPKDVEVFTWWADGGEKAGLDGLVSAFNTSCTGE
jgi:glucose/mannose transport system substrate-binding protein